MVEQLIQYIKNFIPVNNQDLDIILSKFTFEQYDKGIQLTEANSDKQKLYFVCNGCLRIYYINEAGVDATRYFAFENQFVTALVSMISRKPSEEYIQALEHTTVYSISHTNFLALLEEIPLWEKFYRHYLEIAFLNNTNRLYTLSTMDASKRYEELLDQDPIIVQRLPNKIVASYLNVSQETLSRIKTKIWK
ncbi:MAG: Crp/Fnr family transcriptional regulator [Flavobacteriaceae bacterium]|jgi:CRP-like cAMP-binding protein|nr:Crp/Fnr family transcriptional regulator [Flavobacteriaceae bacterium]